MKIQSPFTASAINLDAYVFLESARRQFWLSVVLLFALAFAAVGHLRPVGEAPHLRPVGEAPAAAKLVPSRVVTPTFMPTPAARTPLPWGARVRIA
ncbi:MAG: hypothetical protein ABR878_15685 [Roseiarcus sp.]|jgi:hypothetical protein